MQESEASTPQRLRVTDIHGLGSGIAHGEEIGGRRKVYMTPGSVPGDTIEPLLWIDRGRYTEILEFKLIQPSDIRRADQCPHLNQGCGGCRLPHLNPGDYSRIKQQMLEQQLRSLNREWIPDNVLETGQSGRRTRIEPTWIAGVGPAFTSHSGKPVPLETCAISHPAIREALLQLTPLKSVTPQPTRIMLTKLPSHPKPVLGIQFPSKLHDPLPSTLKESFCAVYAKHDQVEWLHSPSVELYTKALEQRIPWKPGVFTQTNLHVSQTMLQAIREQQMKWQCRSAWDLFCGHGSILFSLSELASGLGLESNPEAIQCAKDKANQNLSFHCAHLPSKGMHLLKDNPKPDMAILNPPRKGLGKRWILAVAPFLPDKLIYMSCNPLSQKKDLKMLTKWGYIAEKMSAFDMFPRTHQCETLLILEKNAD